MTTEERMDALEERVKKLEDKFVCSVSLPENLEMSSPREFVMPDYVCGGEIKIKIERLDDDEIQMHVDVDGGIDKWMKFKNLSTLKEFRNFLTQSIKDM